MLIRLPIVDEPQNYKIIIDVHSRTSIIKKAQKSDGMAAFFFSMVANNTGNIKISYVDYTVAVNFMSIVDGWFNALPRGERRDWSVFLKKYSHEFAAVLKLISVSIFLISSYVYYSRNNTLLGDLIPSAIFVFGVAQLLLSISGRIGSSIERQIDAIYPSSYVLMNRGDELSVEQDRQSTKKSVTLLMVNIIIAFFVNILSSYVWWIVGFK